MKKIRCILLFFILPYISGAQAPDRMQWFREARLGIFIHWGIYAVNGIDESWSFYNGYISHEDYMKQLQGFTASEWNPNQWAELFSESGARYAVMTSKHHDGVALWDTRLSSLNVAEATPAEKDLVGPFCKAMRDKGLKVGLYYSLLDWSHPDYPNFTRSEKRYKDDPERWESFSRFNTGQILELADRYDPDLFWFDGDWEQDAEKWNAEKIRTLLMEENPNVIINSRLAGYGDYATPEQGLPVRPPEDEYWELCMTMNDSWGFQPNDRNYKSTNQIIRIFIDCISMGGNLLLDIGPEADGTIPAEQVGILRELGRWTSKHAEAIYGTHAGIPPRYFYGATTLSPDSTILYLFVPYKPSGPLLIKGISNKVNRAWVVGNGTRLECQLLLKPYWSSHPGLLSIEVPDNTLDEEVTVVAVLLEGKIDLYRER